MSQQLSRAQFSDPSVFAAPSFVWGLPGKPLTVRLPFELIDRLEREVVENFRSIDARGSEIGGLLFGGAASDAPGKVMIEDVELIPCDYSLGPYYRLAPADLARLDAAVERRGGPGKARVAGFFRSHSRKGLALDAEDMKVIDTRFRDPWQIALLVRPFATKITSAGIFIWEDGRMRGDASYREFSFRSSELTAAESAADPVPATANAGEPKPPTRAAVVSMPSRLKIARPSAPATVSGWVDPPEELIAQPTPAPVADSPAAPAVKFEAPASAVVAEPPKPADPPKFAATPPAPLPSEPVAEIESVHTEAAHTDAPPVPTPKASRAKLLWLSVAAALVICSGGLFLYPGLFRHSAPPPATLTLRVEHTATDLLLTWNRDSDAVRTAKKAVLSISDGERQENLDLNLSDLRNGSIVYSPLSSDVSFRMEVTGANQSKTASESVRVLRTKPSPMPGDEDSAAKLKAATKEASAVAPASAPAAPAAPASADQMTAAPAAPQRTPAPTFNVASLADRLRPALPADILDAQAPAVGATNQAGAVNLGALAPATSLTAPAPRPSAPKTTPEPARDIRQPKLIARVDPVYPEIARQQRISGTVSLSVIIGANGKITSVSAISGPVLLRSAAIDAVKQWVYSPMTLNGHALETDKQIDLNFSLNR